MTEGHRTAPSVRSAKYAIAGFAVVGGLLSAAAGTAHADPVPNPPPAPTDPAAAPPGQPVVLPADAQAAPAPPPIGAPTVPEIANPVYGSGKYGSGPLGTLRDLWHQAQNPYELQGPTDGALAAPPPGAGPPPPLPPGYVSMNAPGSETPVTAPEPGSAPAGPALPPGYYPLNGPPPPGYEFQPINGAAPAAPPAAGAPTP
ncbi:hypothetical protein [Mycolicibacterium mageritense]|uniref:hypothetical protein n=1 Tax=Mycolicibacterium mageritense TaxID=53462 RepID=UPI001E40B147|nr:hypothetical protein [Mycolicibacterium mageritense]GJJ19110.1 hypothetical protein MTY414_27830 [Mycolicibacterium mageritense]